MAKLQVEAAQETAIESKIEEKTNSIIESSKVEQLEKMLDFTMNTNQKKAFAKANAKKENLKFSLCYWGEKLVVGVDTLKEYYKDSDNPMERELAVEIHFHDGKKQRMGISRWVTDPIRTISRDVECTNIPWVPWQVGINKHGVDPEFLLELPIDGVMQKTRVTVPLSVCNL